MEVCSPDLIDVTLDLYSRDAGYSDQNHYHSQTQRKSQDGFLGSRDLDAPNDLDWNTQDLLLC